MRIQHNIMAMNSYRNLRGNNTALAKNLEKLSSGYRINRAGDDAAGLAISEKMRAQISGLSQAQKNAQSGINLVQTAEGSLTEVHDMLNRMVTLANQSANGTYENTDRAKLQAEVDALVEEIDRIADNSNFNGQKLLNGELDTTTTSVFNQASSAKANLDVSINGGKFKDSNGSLADLTFKFAVATGTADTNAAATDGGTVTITLKKGAAQDASTIQSAINALAKDAGITNDSLKAALKAVTVTGTGVAAATATGKLAGTQAATKVGGTGTAMVLQIGADAAETISVSVESMKAESLGVKDLDIGSVSAANAAIDKIKAAIETVSTQRGALGAVQNRLEHTINNLGVMEENIQDAESNIRDTDVAEEMMAYTKNNILIQSAQAMLAQANQVPQGVLQLMQ